MVSPTSNGRSIRSIETREQVAQRYLQRQPDDNQRHAECRERVLDLPAPDHRVDHSETDGHEQQAGSGRTQQSGDLAVPAPGLRQFEHHVVDDADDGDDRGGPGIATRSAAPPELCRRQEHDPPEEQHHGEKRDYPCANEPHGRGNGMPAPRERKCPFVEHDEQQRKPDHEGERESPLRLNEIQQFAHAAASSRTENSSIEPMPCTSARVAGPEANQLASARRRAA